MPNEFPARLHVLFAQDAPLGLVIRRGPARRVATLMWDRRTDEFTMGQWLKGRIYELNSDLSPDGKYLIYYALKGNSYAPEGDITRASWTAISRAPYLKALAFSPCCPVDCGGGIWTSNRTYWWDKGYGSIERDTEEVVRDTEFQAPPFWKSGRPNIYYIRLLRDGWNLIECFDDGEYKRRDVFTKEIGYGWGLYKFNCSGFKRSQGKAPCWDEHQLFHKEDGVRMNCPKWEWADLDRDRLVWATGGKLFAGNIDSNGLTNETELYDFNPMSFEPIVAPY